MCDAQLYFRLCGRRLTCTHTNKNRRFLALCGAFTCNQISMLKTLLERVSGAFVELPGLDIGYVPAGPDAFFRWSGQFGPQQLIFYWPAGPVDFFL